MAGVTTSLGSPSGIATWNCKIPSKSQIAPKARRRYVRLRGSLRPALERLKLRARRDSTATSMVNAPSATIHITQLT